MSYREENDQVILTISRKDYDALLPFLGLVVGVLIERFGVRSGPVDEAFATINRINDGNPTFLPYQLESKVAKTTLR